MTYDNLTIALQPGERAALKAAAAAEGHSTISAFVRARVGLPVLQRGRIWPQAVKEAAAAKRAARIEKLKQRVRQLEGDQSVIATKKL